jgi:hypothetical protein
MKGKMMTVKSNLLNKGIERMATRVQKEFFNKRVEEQCYYYTLMPSALTGVTYLVEGGTLTEEEEEGGE